MRIFKEDNHININILGIKIKFRNPFVNQLEDCCSIHNLKALKQKGTKFPHPIGIVIAKDTKIGNNCVIYQNVTIGKKRGGTKEKAPVLGNNVKIYANAVIIGEVKIGDNAIIGAGSVVTKDVPADTIFIRNSVQNVNASEIRMNLGGGETIREQHDLQKEDK